MMKPIMDYIETLINTEKKLAPRKLAIKLVLGDAFLLNENHTYRMRRETAQQLKIKFKKADSAYHLASLLCLPNILKSKTVPYVENKLALNSLKIPLRTISIADLNFLGIKENHLLHETSHVIMWEESRRNLNLKKETGLMTAYLLSESYANYSETIANIYATTEMHQNFLSLNSFWSHSEKEVQLLQKFRAKHGSLIANTSLFLCFLYSNFLYKKISIYECEGIRIFLGQTAANLRVTEIQKLFKISSQLNTHFIMKTGEIFWKTIGIKDNLFESLDFDPVEFILKNPKLHHSLLNLLAKD
ncbi:MAG: hypothetical protein H7Z71_03235 [Moraxellaceae bacterium]|nr:hypothetical protein [Pseudobdellovibrionaceae bacterium]